MKSLRFKISFSYLLLVSITVAISTFAAYAFASMGNTIGEILKKSNRSVRAAENMVEAVTRQENEQLNMQVGGYQRARENFDLYRDRFYKGYEEAYAWTDLPEERELLQNIFASYSAYVGVSDSLHQMYAAGLKAEATLYHQRVVMPLANRLRAQSFKLLEVNQSLLLVTRERVEGIAQTVARLVLAASIVAVVLSLLIGLRFAHNILRPITHLTRTVRAIGQGNLNLKINVGTDDELAELSREFNKMTERLMEFEALNVQQLIAEKSKSESLVAAMPNPVIVTDNQDRVLLLNEAARDMLALEARPDAQLPLPEVVKDLSLTQRILSERPPEGPEAVFRMSVGGADRYYLPKHTTIANAAGEVSLKITLLEDVTRFKELERMKSEFLAAVSHELRTPLTSLGMAVDILRQQVVGTVNQPQQELLEAAKDDTERLKKLVRGLLDLARLESEAAPPSQEEVYFGQVVSEALAPLRLPFRERGIRLDVQAPPDLPVFLGNSQQLGWVMTNLVGNALRYTPPEGRVAVEVSRAPGAIRVCVSDNGRGIPNDVITSIFDKFVQIKSADETTPGSVGLGLAIAKKVVEGHGGKIWAESEEGVGSRFQFEIPTS